MYYRLCSVNGRPLPTPVAISDRDWVLTSGGMLLEPPGHGPHPEDDGTGYSVLALDGGQSEAAPVGTFYWMSYPYRKPGPAEIVVGLGDAVPVARGTCGPGTLRLDLQPGRACGDALSLELVAAPQAPIPATWRHALFCDGIGFSTVGPVRWYHRIIFRMIAAAYSATRPLRRRAARRRLDRAWRAPA